MGWLSRAWTAVKNWVSEKVEAIKDKLGFNTYSHTSVEDQINVDKVLEEFRQEIESDISKAENKCMEDIVHLFAGLKEKTKERFPDLVNVINNKQEAAEKALSGTVIQYVKEHLSKNNSSFLKVLEMKPGQAKCDALDRAAKKAIEDAQSYFYNKLSTYFEEIQMEFSSRLETRLTDQDRQLDEYIMRLESLEKQAEKGKINMDELVSECAPIMEAAGSALAVLEME